MTYNDQGIPVWLLTFQESILNDDGNYTVFYREHAAETIEQAMGDGVTLANDMGDASFIEAEEMWHCDDACPTCPHAVVLSIRASITNLVKMMDDLRRQDASLTIARVPRVARDLDIARLDGGIDALNKLLASFCLTPSPTSTP